MEEVEELLKQFELIQEQNYKKYLINERTCIEILYKLIKKKSIKLITTIDGETLLTYEYISKKIYELVNNEGRISINKISKILKIQKDIVLKLLKDIEKKYNYIIYKEDIITKKYIDEIFYIINEELQDLHKLSLISISEKNDLSIEFIKNEIKNRNKDEIKGIVVSESNNNLILISNTYLKSIEHMIKASLIVSKKPILINDILDIELLDEHIIIEYIKELLNKAWIDGYLYQNKLFIPRIYFNNQIIILKNYLIDNGYLKIEEIKKLLIYIDMKLDLKNNILKEWVELNILKGNSKILIMNNEYILLSSIIEIILDNIIKFCFENNNYTYINHLLPHILSNESNKNYCLDLINLFENIETSYKLNIKWLFIFFDNFNSFTILNKDGSEYVLKYKDSENDKMDIYDKDSNEFDIFSQDNTIVLFISNFYLIINFSLIRKILRILYFKIELIINKMILAHFYLLPSPSCRFGNKMNKKQINDYNFIYRFILNIVENNNIKEFIISEIEKEWSDILNDNPIVIEGHSFEDYIWNFMIRIISPYIVNHFNNRMKDLYDPLNISRTFHIQDET